MQSIFAKTYIHCYLKLTGSDFTFFADENFGGKKLSLSEAEKKVTFHHFKWCGVFGEIYS